MQGRVFLCMDSCLCMGMVGGFEGVLCPDFTCSAKMSMVWRSAVFVGMFDLHASLRKVYFSFGGFPLLLSSLLIVVSLRMSTLFLTPSERYLRRLAHTREICWSRKLSFTLSPSTFQENPDSHIVYLVKFEKA